MSWRSSILALLRSRTGLPPRACFSSKKFYDSQSGSFIAVPGSQGLRIHDTYFSSKTKVPEDNTTDAETSDKRIIEYMRHNCGKGITSMSLAQMSSNEQFRQNIATSVQYLHRNSAKLPIQIAAQVWNAEQASIICAIAQQQAEARDILCTESDLAMLDHKSRVTTILPYLKSLSDSGVTTRVNIYIDIDPFQLGNGQGKRLTPVIEVGEVLASLCDQGVKVLNLGLGSSSGAQLGNVSERARGDIEHYLMEVVEEGLNLDVAGDPLLERLSLQCPPSHLLPGLSKLARTLGLTRLSVCGAQKGAKDRVDMRDQHGAQVLVAGIDDSEVQTILREASSGK